MPDDPHTNGSEPYMTVRDMVTEIRFDLKALSAKVADQSAVEDHEHRIRGLERWKYAIPPSLLLGAASIVGGVVSALVR